MTWQIQPPPALVLAAGKADLGPREFVTRGRRPIGSAPRWGILGAGALVTAIAALAGVVWLAALALPIAAVGLAGYAYAVPPRGGRLWIAVHERGLVLSRPLAAVGWGDVGYDGDVLTAAVGDGPGRVRTPVGDLSRRDRLVNALLRHTQPLVLANATELIADGRRVTFGPLTIDAGGLRQAGAGDRLPWADIGTVRLIDGDKLYIGRAEPRRAWFDGIVPDPLAAATVIVGRTRQGPADPVNEELARRDRLAAADERRAVRTLAAIVAGVVLLTGAGTAVAAARAADPAPPAAATPTETQTTAPAPVSTPPPSLPYDSSEWEEVCTFREFPAAAPYAGPGPHPIAFVVSGSRGSSFPSRPAAWEPPTIKATQLVACIDGVQGPVVGTCDYSDGVSGQLLHSKYEIKIFETRTRALVASFTLLGASTACSVIVTVPRGATPKPQYTLVTEAQMRTAFAPYVEAPR